MKLTCPNFRDGESIPSQFTCEGKDTNPPLEFSDVPKEAKSLVLIMDDPDVPAAVRPDQMYDHWVIFNMPPSTRSIPANTTPPGIEGNGTRKTGYEGPCPPRQYAPTKHRYFFKLYALDRILDLKKRATKKEVEKAMQGHILDEAKLLGCYEKIK
jgi:hypothetical protein